MASGHCTRRLSDAASLAFGEGPMPAIHINGNVLTVVSRFHMRLDVPPINLIAQPGRLFLGPALADWGIWH